jgi:hypothetical protein
MTRDDAVELVRGLRRNVAAMCCAPEEERDGYAAEAEGIEDEIIAALLSRLRAVPQGWRDISTAPRDFTIIELLVDYTDADFSLDQETSEDGLSVTLGLNGRDNIGEEGDIWQIVGWDWSQDYFMETTDENNKFKVLAWRPRRTDTTGWPPAAPATEKGVG